MATLALMAAATTIPNKSNLSFPFNPTNSLYHRCLKKDSSFPHSFSASASIFCSRIVLRKTVSDDGRKGFWVPKTVENLIRTCAFRESNSDEAFLDGSSESIRSTFLFRRVESIINRLSKWIITAIFNGYILWRHDAETLWFALGSTLNLMLSLELKQILNQERPSTLKSDPGMPSSHSQTVFFIAMFAIVSSIKWLGMNEFTVGISGLTLALSFYFSYLRVSQQYHTVSQVVVGGAIGVLFCGSWHWLWNAFLENAIQSSFPLQFIIVSASTAFWFTYTSCSIVQWFQ